MAQFGPTAASPLISRLLPRAFTQRNWVWYKPLVFSTILRMPTPSLHSNRSAASCPTFCFADIRNSSWAAYGLTAALLGIAFLSPSPLLADSKEHSKAELLRTRDLIRANERASVAATFRMIQGGVFEMGEAVDLAESQLSTETSGGPSPRVTLSNTPLHSVEIRPFYMAESEVSFGEWKVVRDWAKEHGYDFDNEGIGKADNHPVVKINWLDAVKWCNAKSERAGFRPCYYTLANTGMGVVFRAGKQISKLEVNTDYEGFRLPTEAEWEKAARGRLARKKFPTGNSLSGRDANFDNQTGGTKPVLNYLPNGYGLYNMAGNAWEWCWDWYFNGYLEDATLNPHGPAKGSNRVVRGGGWQSPMGNCTVGYRYCYSP
ncbi:MAG: SUMF1/EgtB/PvdO family nonheme iron enzyme, partial [Verrucomicrobiota bacterium]